ncbi:hypothetical protein [Serratia fonticola]|uniref:Uncharacterized protein n=1 Tax=Serratia fonticola TaxID=47917 RepID=A0AAE7EEU5_SERFO|nr:hypothetical protein [Serratia fonticola]QKJ57270.1 hypothetical protein G9399_01230 [Serratia fonticola]
MKLKNALPCLLLLVPAIALAQWKTKAEEDIFTGGKKATMVATVGNFNSTNAIIFDCTKSELSLAYIEKLNGTVKNYNIPFNMIVKIDAGEIKKTDAVASQRNDQYVQVISNDRDTIIQILKEASKGKSKMIVGISEDDFGQYSVTASLDGSSKAVNQFASACEIDIK